MDTVETLQEMKNILMERNWCKGQLIDIKGRVCLIGARNLATGMPMEYPNGRGNYAKCRITNLIESIMPYDMTLNNCSPNETIAYRVNDQADSVNEVLALIDDAILIAKEKGI